MNPIACFVVQIYRIFLSQGMYTVKQLILKLTGLNWEELGVQKQKKLSPSLVSPVLLNRNLGILNLTVIEKSDSLFIFLFRIL